MANARTIIKARYDAKKKRQVNLAFYENDSDLYSWLMAQPNRNGYIKDLIRKDMKARATSFNNHAESEAE